MAYCIAARDSVEVTPRGGTRACTTKITPGAKKKLEEYLNDNCTYSLKSMRSMLLMDKGIDVDTPTISRHLLGMTYTVKEMRVEPMTCNSDVNKAKGQSFAKELKNHQAEGDFIVYFDETNYNIHCTRTRGRAKKGKKAILRLPPPKGSNLQIQCAVNSTMGLVLHRLEKGRIRMEQNAAFIKEIYRTVKASATFREHFASKKIVIVFDNAPAHRRTEERVEEHDDLVLLRLAPYSPMCNPMGGCFSVLMARIKEHLALDRAGICNRTNMTEQDYDRGATHELP
ncbi:hypothetical protein PC121_g7438 [Phytophthora cactorum]|nr:hypothetical protein PC120_g24809 [Phytophthora cactorum]KAG3077327.1 hypothetical protein PC121_g7438 [Phytophthora cactorum]